MHGEIPANVPSRLPYKQPPRSPRRGLLVSDHLKRNVRVSEKQVAINIGAMELNRDGVANILRGKTLPLVISEEADYTKPSLNQP